MYDGEKAKYELVSMWLVGHPCPSWDDVESLLGMLERDGRGRNGAADEVKEKYLTSELQYTMCSFQLRKVAANLRNTIYTFTCTYTSTRKSDCFGCAVLLCLVCLFDLACFFLPSFSSLI